MSPDRPRLVYSTGAENPREAGAADCPRCHRAPCSCPEQAVPPPSEQSVGVRREKAGRRGKTVTVAGPFQLARPAARDLLKSLQRECGSGGTLKTAPGPAAGAAWVIEIQGDHVERVVRRLATLGFRSRRAGG